MIECGVSEDTVIGAACRQISGTGPKSCHLLQAVGRESRETVGDLSLTVGRVLECPFQERVLDRIREKARQPKGLLATAHNISGIPRALEEFTAELGRLNDNLEGLAPTLKMVPEFLRTLDRLAEATGDLAEVIAPFNGLEVVRGEKARRPAPDVNKQSLPFASQNVE